MKNLQIVVIFAAMLGSSCSASIGKTQQIRYIYDTNVPGFQIGVQDGDPTLYVKSNKLNTVIKRYPLEMSEEARSKFTKNSVYITGVNFVDSPHFVIVLEVAGVQLKIPGADLRRAEKEEEEEKMSGNKSTNDSKQEAQRAQSSASSSTTTTSSASTETKTTAAQDSLNVEFSNDLAVVTIKKSGSKPFPIDVTTLPKLKGLTPRFDSYTIENEQIHFWVNVGQGAQEKKGAFIIELSLGQSTNVYELQPRTAFDPSAGEIPAQPSSSESKSQSQSQTTQTESKSNAAQGIHYIPDADIRVPVGPMLQFGPQPMRTFILAAQTGSRSLFYVGKLFGEVIHEDKDFFKQNITDAQKVKVFAHQDDADGAHTFKIGETEQDASTLKVSRELLNTLMVKEVDAD